MVKPSAFAVVRFMLSATFRQTLTQSCDTHFGARRAAPDVTDARYRALLRARGERPRKG